MNKINIGSKKMMLYMRFPPPFYLVSYIRGGGSLNDPPTAMGLASFYESREEVMRETERKTFMYQFPACGHFAPSYP